MKVKDETQMIRGQNVYYTLIPFGNITQSKARQAQIKGFVLSNAGAVRL